MKRTKSLTYIIVFTLIGLIGAFLLQSIWLYNTFILIRDNIQEECSNIVVKALAKEGNIRFAKAPKGTRIISGPVKDSIPAETYFYEGLTDLGYPISLNDMDSIASVLLKDFNIESDFAICIMNPKNNKILQSSKIIENNKWLAIKSTPFPIRSNCEQAIQLIITNPLNTFIERMGTILLSTIIIMFSVFGCIVYQMRIISRLNKIFQIREDFSYALIHDMKTPISTIFMTLNFLHTGRLDDKPEKKEKYFQIAEGEADHLLTLTNKVLTISKLEQHKLEMHKEELELEPVIDDLINKFTAKAEKPVHFIKDLQAEVIHADEEFFGEVLSNLIDNAIKYSKESVEITISSTNNEPNTILKVHDNGLGISDEDQRVIFNKYERAAAGRQKRKKGSSGFGLGLNFVQQVVEAHEGKIFVNSIEGEFTEFVIYLPQIMQKL